MKKNKEKAQLKANRKQSLKAVKNTLVNDLTNLISTYAEPNKKLKKLVEKAAATFAKEIEKTAKPVNEVPIAANNVEAKEQDAKTTKPRIAKKSVKSEQK